MGNRGSGIFQSQMTTGLLALAFFLILATSAVSVTSTNSLGRSIDAVNHSYQVLNLATEMKVSLGEAHSNGLRFIVTGSPENHMLQRQALAKLGQLNKDFAELTKDNALQRSYIADFNTYYDQFVERSLQGMRIKEQAMKTGDMWGPIERVRSGKGYIIIKELKEVLEKVTTEESRLMQTRIQERDDLVKQTNATVLIANALALVAGILGFAAIRRSQSESEKILLAELKAEQARRANEEKSSFLANMSHEIRTPMNAIFGFTQLLSESVTSPLEKDWVMSIKKSGKILLGLINDVLDLSKIEAGKLQLQLQPTDVRDMINETIEIFQPIANDKGIFLTQEIDMALSEPLMLDGQRIRQLLMNLLSNAMKYTERGGVLVRLAISTQADPKMRTLKLHVTDSGVGIDPEQLGKIFEPFHQADSPDGRVRQGTGLGLSICQRLADVMGGTISVISDIGKGSTFTVAVPNVMITDITPEGYVMGSAKANFNLLPPLKVLVVDDVPWNIEVAQGYLRDSHHEVYIANSGMTALASAKALKPDVVLMDLRMPGMSGFEASDAIRSDPQLQDVRIEIVAVTASSLNNEEKALRESFDGYVRKPYTPVDLFTALDAIFGENRTPLNKPSNAPRIWTVEMQARWQQIRNADLIELRQTMRMREVGDYAKRLRIFSAESDYPLLTELAVNLLDAVQRFDISSVNKILAEIAGLPEHFNDI